MRISDLDYHLPPQAIATQPAVPRDASRLMVVGPGDDAPSHHQFRDLTAFLRPGDLLVVNQTRVVPAKLALVRKSGAAIGGLFLREIGTGLWEVMLRTRGKVKVGESLTSGGFDFALAARLGEGLWQVRVTPPLPASEVLQKIGHVPLPPYITRQRKAGGHAEETPADRMWYQTVYAGANAGATAGDSVAAPTAGLHFTPELLSRLEAMGVERATVELAVGPGTFLPVESETLEAHVMHAERYLVPAATVAALRQARAQGRRIVVVGTTAVRTLESVASTVLDPLAATNSAKNELSGQTRLLIAPGYQFRLTDVLVTNFHLPRSTLMALVGAFLGEGGVARLKALYAEAIARGYRFYSYGDAMMITGIGL